MTTITKRYFLDRKGVPVKRIQGSPGERHVDIAEMVLGPIAPGTDVYAAMFRLKYIRVAEDSTTKTIYVDASAATFDKLTNGQRRFLKNMQAEGWQLVFNSREFLETRDTAGQEVKHPLD